MNAAAKVAAVAAALPEIARPDPAAPIFVVLARDAIAIAAAVSFGGLHCDVVTAIPAPEGGYIPGSDYGVKIVNGVPVAELLAGVPGEDVFGGFHFAPGGNATARAGGDDQPAINPRSVWDQGFRPACADPRGMALVTPASGARPFWVDIYLLGVDHNENGTSRFGVKIADGKAPPTHFGGGKPYSKFDYATAVEVLALHQKTVPSLEEFFALAHGVTEKTAIGDDPDITGLDAPRTSRFGVMQATGNLWVWGHDGDPDEPRASFFGGSWWDDGLAGSRCASGDGWPGDSNDYLSARGRCDHLGPA